MNINHVLNSKPKNTNGTFSKSSLPKEKVEGFYKAFEKTDMLEVVEKIKKEKITKP